MTTENHRYIIVRLSMRIGMTFLTNFLICLAYAVAAFFAAKLGVFTTVFNTDMSMMTSVIAALFVGTVVYLSWQAWLIDHAYPHPNSGKFGHLAERLSTMCGLAGTAIGLSLQASTLALGGAAAFAPLATSLYCTFSGVIAAGLIAILTYNVDAGANG